MGTTRSGRRSFLGAATVAAALIALGCGGGGGDDPVEAARDFMEAFLDDDAAGVCGVMTDAAAAELIADAEADDCVGAFTEFSAIFQEQISDEQREKAGAAEYELVEEDGDSATVNVTLEGGEAAPAELEKVDGEWKVSEFGG